MVNVVFLKLLSSDLMSSVSFSATTLHAASISKTKINEKVFFLFTQVILSSSRF
jgi:hypothetical protein